MTPPPSTGNGATFVILGVLALVVLVGGGALFLFANSDGGGGDPVESVEAYYEAALARDCAGALDHVTENLWRQTGATSRQDAIARCESAVVDGTFTRPTSITLVSESGDTAVVEAIHPAPDVPTDPNLDVEIPDDPVEIRYTLVDDGGWKIDGTEAGGLGAPPTAGETGADVASGAATPGTTPETSAPETTSPTLPPPTANEVWGERTDYTFEITLSDRTLTGRLRLTNRQDLSDCASAAADPSITPLLSNCIGRIEAVYLGENDGIHLDQQVLTFTDEASASAFVAALGENFAAELINYPNPGDIANAGWAETRTGQTGVHVVSTLMVSTPGDDASVRLGLDHLHALQAETSTFFIWR